MTVYLSLEAMVHRMSKECKAVRANACGMLEGAIAAVKDRGGSRARTLGRDLS